MCGFGGTINWKKKVTIEKLTKAANAVSFRGPDNTDLRLYDLNFKEQQSEGEIAVFFNRLAIIDLDKRSNQPFENERYLLVFNGEIYNYKEIRGQLQSRDISFLTSSDTEVLFQALINYGVTVIEQLNGMFAFVFIDKIERKIILARDRTGIKPLIFQLSHSGFAFASETDSVIRFSESKPAISQTAINLYLSLQYVPTPFTVWENIFKLPPGCYAEECIDDLKNNKGITPIQYWNVYVQANKQLNEERDLETLMCNSIESQLQSDVPLGFFLSSGIDSSLLAALVNAHFSGNKQFDFFTVAFNNESEVEADEYQDANNFLEGLMNKNFVHHPLYINPSSIQDEVMAMYTYLDEPFGDYAVMLNYVISKKAKEHVTVVLSGDGSDELFWGYPRYNEWVNHNEKIKAATYSRHLEKVAAFIPQTSLKEKVQRRYSSDVVINYLNIVSATEFSKKELLSGNQWWWQGINNIKCREDLPALVDFKTYLPDCMFYKVDRSSMGASLEVRVPYLDNHVVNYALQMNVVKKSTKKFSTKAPAKELLMKLAPHYQITLPKKGFSLPLRDWITNDWKTIVFSKEVMRYLADLELLETYKALLNSHFNKNRDCSVAIWRLMNLALWYKTKKELLG